MGKGGEYICQEDDRICHDYDNMSKEELLRLLAEHEKEIIKDK